jgi:hypothetical protein
VSLNFLIGAALGSAIAVFGVSQPVRRLVQSYKDRQRR